MPANRPSSWTGSESACLTILCPNRTPLCRQPRPRRSRHAAHVPPVLHQGGDPGRSQPLRRQRTAGPREPGNAQALHQADHRRLEEDPREVPSQGTGRRLIFLLAAGGRRRLLPVSLLSSKQRCPPIGGPRRRRRRASKKTLSPVFRGVVSGHRHRAVAFQRSHRGKGRAESVWVRWQ